MIHLGNSTYLKAGDVLNERYSILSILGKGGMGTVYLAQDLRLKGKLWAVKESIQPIKYQQFIDEVQILTELDHPNLPKVVDYLPPNNEKYSYLVMDYIKGQTLSDVFEQQNKILHYSRVIKYCVQLCDLLDYLHNHKPFPIIYRDLKPGNIMLDDQDNIKLIDFGIARNYREGQEADTVQIGTIGFAAPEQFEKMQTDSRTDLFSLGAMMYFLLCSGKYIYSTYQTYELLGGDLPRNLIKIIKRSTMMDPNDRYQDALEFKNDLLRLINNGRDTRTSSNKLPSHKYTNIPSKLIVIGSMWNGAGSTTFATNLARALAKRALPVTYVEYPTVKPYMFDYLNIADKEKIEGFQYCDIARSIEAKESSTKEKGWNYKGIQWVVTDSRYSTIRGWTYEKMIELIYSLRATPIIIVDISNRWLDQDVKQFLLQADAIYLCVEPNPIKVDWLSTVADYASHKASDDIQREEFKSLQYLNEIKAKENIPCEFITVKMNAEIDKKVWSDCLDKKPISTLPYIPYPDVMKEIWNSGLLYDVPDYHPMFEKAFAPIITELLPEIFHKVEIESTRRGFQKAIKSIQSMIRRRPVK